jgi:hypothetical protein
VEREKKGRGEERRRKKKREEKEDLARELRSLAFVPINFLLW